MQKIVINGGKRLHGEVRVSGSKNAALPILASALLARGRSTFRNVPALGDVRTMGRLLGRLGAEVTDGDKGVMALITGITLTGTGYGLSDHDTMGKAGVITMLVSAPALAGSIWLILDSRARAEVVPFDAGPVLMARLPSQPHLVWGPGFVAGTF